MLIISGQDGAGKSTLIEWLRLRLEAERRPVVVFHKKTILPVHVPPGDPRSHSRRTSPGARGRSARGSARPRPKSSRATLLAGATLWSGKAAAPLDLSGGPAGVPVLPHAGGEGEALTGRTSDPYLSAVTGTISSPRVPGIRPQRGGRVPAIQPTCCGDARPGRSARPGPRPRSVTA